MEKFEVDLMARAKVLQKFIAPDDIYQYAYIVMRRYIDTLQLLGDCPEAIKILVSNPEKSHEIATFSVVMNEIEVLSENIY